jgi:hypothetical protein
MHSLITDESIGKNKFPSHSSYVLLIVADKVIFIVQNFINYFMKKYSTLLLLSCFFSAALFAQSVGVGTTTPDNSAQLDVSSADKGLLVPRYSQQA